MTRLFYGCSHSSLVPGAGARLAARANLSIFRDILPKDVCLFIVDAQGFICAELTKFGLGKEATVTAAFCASRGSSIFNHLVLQFS